MAGNMLVLDATSALASNASSPPTASKFRMYQQAQTDPIMAKMNWTKSVRMTARNPPSVLYKRVMAPVTSKVSQPGQPSKIPPNLMAASDTVPITSTLKTSPKYNAETRATQQRVCRHSAAHKIQCPSSRPIGATARAYTKTVSMPVSKKAHHPSCRSRLAPEQGR